MAEGITTTTTTTTIPPSLATEGFETFYSMWLVDQQRYLDQLILLSNKREGVSEQGDKVDDDDDDDDEQIRSFSEEVMSHYHRYYEEKAKAMAQDESFSSSLIYFLSAPWVRPLEKELLWMGGFNPCFALRLLEASVNDMSSDQKGRLEAVREEVEAEERAVEDEKERVSQRTLAWAQAETNGEIVVEEEMREVMRRADALRRETVTEVVRSLRGRQRVKFLVAVGSYWLGMRSLGLNFPL